MTCECGFKGINCDQGRLCPLRKPVGPRNEKFRPGLSSGLLRFLGIYLAIVFALIVAAAVLSR